MTDESVMVLDLSDGDTKRRLMSHVGNLRSGLYEVSIKPRRQTRSLNANRYYFQCVVGPWLAWLRENEGSDFIDKEQAHEALKLAVLGMKTVENRETGAVVVIPPRTRRMKTDEFSDYVERCIKFLAEFCGIEVLESEMFYQR
jgi:hypothetical protein